MRQKHSESAQEQRIALYKSDHHGNMCHLRTLSWSNCVTSKQCLHTMFGITFLIFKELAFSMHALPKNDGLAPASKRDENLITEFSTDSTFSLELYCHQ